LRNKARQLIIILFLPMWLCLASLGQIACAGRLDPELQGMMDAISPDDEISVIVKFTNDLSSRLEQFSGLPASRLIQALQNRARFSEQEVKAFLEGLGIKKVTTLWIINSLSLTVSASLIPIIASFQKVEEVRLDGVIQLPETTTTPAGAVEWNIDLTGAPELWDRGYRGQGVVVAAMDTGADLQHPDLTDRWRGGANSWLDPNGEHPDLPYDADGHGTQVMGLLVGGDAGGSSIGMAPDAKWIAVKIFNDARTADYSVIHEGFQWLLDPDGDPLTDDAPHLINNSWGLDRDDKFVNKCVTEFEADIQVLKTAGIGVVFAAGNFGDLGASTSVSPANYPDSLAVGSISESLGIAPSSSRGPSACNGAIFPQLVAPGVSVRTADLTAGGVIPDSYVGASGTSFAAPHVTGAMALLMSAFPDAGLAELEEALIKSARDLGPSGPDNDYGYGLVDADNAYLRLQGDRGLTAALFLLLLSD